MSTETAVLKDTATKFLLFDGTFGNFDPWQSHTKNCFIQRGYRPLFDVIDDPDLEIPKDDGYRELGEDGKEVALSAEEKKLKDLNERAMTHLKTAFDPKCQFSQSAWGICKNTIRRKRGYKYGNFKQAWLELQEHYKLTDIKDLMDLQKEYNEKRMGFTESPRIFITEIQDLRRQLEDDFDEESEDIPEKTFVRDIIQKLPTPRNPAKDVDIYAQEKKEILKALKDGDASYDSMKVMNILTTQHRICFPSQYKKSSGLHVDSGLSATEQKNDHGNTAQVKGPCYKCGKWGHKSMFCKSGKNNNGGNSSNNRSGGGNSNGSRGGGNQDKRKCYYCKETGHIKPNCPKLKAKKKKWQWQ